MTSTKQLAANRANARKSTGPKSQSGKAVVAGNATKHGILSGEVLLEGENSSELLGFSHRMRGQLSSVGEVEELLTDRIITSAWRLRRVIAVEAGIFSEELESMLGEECSLGLAFIRDGNQGDSFSKLSRYEAGIERGMYRAVHELQRLQAARSGQQVPPPVVLDVDVAGQ